MGPENELEKLLSENQSNVNLDVLDKIAFAVEEGHTVYSISWKQIDPNDFLEWEKKVKEDPEDYDQITEEFE